MDQHERGKLKPSLVDAPLLDRGSHIAAAHIMHCKSAMASYRFATREQARQVVFKYIEVFYNCILRHAKSAIKPPLISLTSNNWLHNSDNLSVTKSGLAQLWVKGETKAYISDALVSVSGS